MQDNLSTLWGFEYSYHLGGKYFKTKQYKKALDSFKLAFDSLREKDLRHPIAKEITRQIRVTEIFANDRINGAISGLLQEDWEGAYRLSVYLKALDFDLWQSTPLGSGDKIIREQSLWVYTAKNGRNGLRRLDGEIVYPPFYDFIYPVQRGRILTQNEGKWYFRDRKMRKLHDAPLQEAQLNCSGLHPVKRNGVYNIYDNMAKPIFHLWSMQPIQYTGTFPIPFQKGKYWGYKDLLDRWVIEPKFHKAFPFSDGFARVIFKDMQGVINEKGDWVIKPTIMTIGDFQEGLAPFKKQDKWGFINKTGQVVIPAKFQQVGNFHEGSCPVQFQSAWTFINDTGTPRFHPKYKQIKPIQNHLFNLATPKKGEVHLINMWGVKVPDPNYLNGDIPILDNYTPESNLL